MTLPHPLRSAVLEVVRRLRAPDSDAQPVSIGPMVLEAMAPMESAQQHAVFDTLRLSLGLSAIPGSLARWARGKSREEVAQALERIAA